MANIIHFPVGSLLIDYYINFGWEAFAVENGEVYLRFAGTK